MHDLQALFTNLSEPTRFFIMKWRDAYAGYTSLHDGPGTAVHPFYRNRGVATYLKSRAIERGIRDGQKRFSTSSANPALQRVNVQLGYRFKDITEVRFLKDLSTD